MCCPRVLFDLDADSCLFHRAVAKMLQVITQPLTSVAGRRAGVDGSRQACACPSSSQAVGGAVAVEAGGYLGGICLIELPADEIPPSHSEAVRADLARCTHARAVCGAFINACCCIAQAELPGAGAQAAHQGISCIAVGRCKALAPSKQLAPAGSTAYARHC